MAPGYQMRGLRGIAPSLSLYLRAIFHIPTWNPLIYLYYSDYSSCRSRIWICFLAAHRHLIPKFAQLCEGLAPAQLALI